MYLVTLDNFSINYYDFKTNIYHYKPFRGQDGRYWDTNYNVNSKHDFSLIEFLNDGSFAAPEIITFCFTEKELQEVIKEYDV